MATTSLFAMRRAVGALLDAAFEPFGVTVLWDAPSQAEDVERGLMAWWADPTDIAVTPYTLPSGLEETYEQTLVLAVLPADADVTPENAADAVDELMTAVYEVVPANPHPVDSSEGWDVLVRFAGYTFTSGLRPNPPGYAAGFEVRIGVEATRCD
jgi:hypothetical protein